MKNQLKPYRNAFGIFRVGDRCDVRNVVVTDLFPNSGTAFVEESPNRRWPQGVGHVLPLSRVASKKTLRRKLIAAIFNRQPA